MNILLANQRRTVRGPVNPFDKATVISILPKLVHETKPTIQPGIFDILPGNIEYPQLLVVGPSSWWREIDENQPLMVFLPVIWAKICQVFHGCQVLYH